MCYCTAKHITIDTLLNIFIHVSKIIILTTTCHHQQILETKERALLFMQCTLIREDKTLPCTKITRKDRHLVTEKETATVTLTMQTMMAKQELQLHLQDEAMETQEQCLPSLIAFKKCSCCLTSSYYYYSSRGCKKQCYCYYACSQKHSIRLVSVHFCQL